MRDQGESAKCFLPTVNVVSLESFIRVEDACRELRTYRGEDVCGKSPGAPSEVSAEDLDAVYDCDLDGGDWALIDLEATPDGTVAGRAREIRESFRCILHARREDGGKVPQNLLELLCSLAEGPIATPSSEITSSLERLKAHCSALSDKLIVPGNVH